MTTTITFADDNTVIEIDSWRNATKREHELVWYSKAELNESRSRERMIMNRIARGQADVPESEFCRRGMESRMTPDDSFDKKTGVLEV
eukprot:CAMPEP_0119560916 /NCGR_PEP_ID=MMETSP1352-20130426/16177_1 /TAXON_ID=265584 /ORGANISM="Stauroneis constricta, Strain CCMP1120" /LENGTH=87 /DNA_ID=CAMNT_0007608989 /DNA_START=24 /DNA_END=283 /DNA_ORIENTATION=+